MTTTTRASMCVIVQWVIDFRMLILSIMVLMEYGYGLDDDPILKNDEKRCAMLWLVGFLFEYIEEDIA